MESILGVCAAAGGDLSFVVVQHLAPDHPSLMEKTPSTHTDLEVCAITQGMRSKANVLHGMTSEPGLRL